MRVVTNGEFEIRAAEGSAAIDGLEGSIIRGVPIVFNSLSVDLGGFKERIRPEAVNRTLREQLDVRALVDHESAKVLGRMRSGTLSLRKTADGLASRIEPPDTTYAVDLMKSLRRGDVSGMSFGFMALDDEWHLEDGLPIREVIDMRIREISVVTFPAYEATDVSLAKRSLDAFRAEIPKLGGGTWRPSLEFRERMIRAGLR